MKNNLKDLIVEYLEYAEVAEGKSRLTMRNYRLYLEEFLKFAVDMPVAKIDKRLIQQYRLYLNRKHNQRGGELSKKTQNLYLIALRGLLKYLSRQDIASLDPEKIDLAKVGERQITFLEGTELDRFLEAPLLELQHLPEGPEQQRKIILLAYRDKAILELLFSTGLRISELSNLKRNNLNLNQSEFSVRGKGGKVRVVFLSNQARHWIKEYLNKRADTELGLFVRHDRAGKGKEINLSPRSIERLVEKYRKISGITKHVTPHTMRHSFATDLLSNQADLRSVQEMLGHASLTTTQIYTHVTNPQLRAVYERAHDVKRKKKG